MRTILVAAALLAALSVAAQAAPDCPDGYKACGNVCCPK